MISDSVVKEFQKINKQSDVMGVVRTLYPDIEIVLTKKKAKK